MATQYYPAILEPSSEGWGVIFPDLPGLVSGGDTVELAIAHAAEGLAAHVQGMITDGDVVPAPGPVDQVPDWLDGVDLARSVRALVPLQLDPDPVRVNVSFERGFLARLDAVAEARGLTRSAFLAEAARAAMRG